MIKLTTLLPKIIKEDLRRLKQDTLGPTYDPFTAPQWAAIRAEMLSPTTTDERKEEIRDEVFNRNLRFIPFLWFNNKRRDGTEKQSWRDKFGYVDEEEYEGLANEKMLDTWNTFNWRLGTQFITPLRKNLYNALQDLNKKNYREVPATRADTTDATGQDVNLEPGEQGRATTAIENQISPVLVQLANNPRFLDRVETFKNRPGITGNQTAIIDWIIDGDFYDKTLAQLGVERGVTTQTMAAALGVVRDWIMNDRVISDIIEFESMF